MEKPSTQEIKERIEDKIEQIEEYLTFLAGIVPPSYEEYKNDLVKKAVCERYSEKIIEAIIDLAFLTARYLKFGLPAQITDKEIFDVFANKKIISLQLASRLQDAKGMRNIIVHEYGKLNDEVVFEAVSSELERDAKEFINSIKEILK